jgi:hypothetical protein
MIELRLYELLYRPFFRLFGLVDHQPIASRRVMDAALKCAAYDLVLDTTSYSKQSKFVATLCRLSRRIAHPRYSFGKAVLSRPVRPAGP